jgi:predicted nucleic acid-binding protein
MFKEIVSLAREHRLSTYDASYLDLAMRLGLSLSTQDKSLMKAAVTCRVPFYEPARPR